MFSLLPSGPDHCTEDDTGGGRGEVEERKRGRGGGKNRRRGREGGEEERRDREEVETGGEDTGAGGRTREAGRADPVFVAPG